MRTKEAVFSIEEIAMHIALAICPNESFHDLEGRFMRMSNQDYFRAIAHKFIDEKNKPPAEVEEFLKSG